MPKTDDLVHRLYKLKFPEPKGYEEEIVQDDFVASMNGVFDEAMAIFVTRSEDYDASCTTLDYFPYGPQSFLQDLWKKFLRIHSRSQHIADFSKRDPALYDSLIDLINYAAFYLIWLKQREKPSDDGTVD